MADPLKVGSVVFIPCRHCGRGIPAFEVQEGVHVRTCATCGRATRIEVYRETGEVRVRTEPA
jgi:ribosomal protein L37E